MLASVEYSMRSWRSKRTSPSIKARNSRAMDSRWASIRASCSGENAGNRMGAHQHKRVETRTLEWATPQLGTQGRLFRRFDGLQRFVDVALHRLDVISAGADVLGVNHPVGADDHTRGNAGHAV